MASLTIARPGRVSERQYLGDLVRLFERQRARNGVSLTPDSFAADLAAHDSLRSGLFTLCIAISHMGESDLSPEELLDLVARAVSGAEDRSADAVPEDMRIAFLTGFDSWRNRDTQMIADLAEPQPWPPEASSTRKPPMRENVPEAWIEPRAAAVAGAELSSPSAPPAASHSRKTVQEAIGLVRRMPHDADSGDLDSVANRPGDATVGSMTLGEIKHILEEIEDRVIRLGPHLQQLGATHSAVRSDRRHSRSQDAVIEFPLPHGESEDGGPHSSPSDVEPALADASEIYDRPPGIDALLAAAPAWASATPTARSFSEDAFLSRHAYLSPSRRPGTYPQPPASSLDAVAQALAPPFATVMANPLTPGLAPLPAPPAAPTHTVPPMIGLDVEDDPLLSPAERVQIALLRLSPRKVFLTLAALTVFAGGLAGFIAYRTLHTGHVPRFSDLESPLRLATPQTAVPAVTAPSVISTAVVPPPASAPSSGPAPGVVPIHPAAPVVSTATAAPSLPARTVPIPATTLAKPSRPRPSAPIVRSPPVVISPFAANPAGQTVASLNVPDSDLSNTAGPDTAPAETLYVPAPTMIAFALTSPQPAYPAAQAGGISGTVAVDITVSRLGSVISARAVSGPPELRPAALAAVRGWRFRPYLVDGVPAVVATTIEFYFKGD